MRSTRTGDDAHVVVWMPYRETDRWRRDAQVQAVRQARSLKWPVLVGDSGDEPFSVARTWNRLAVESDELPDGWDVAVRWLADMLVLKTDSVMDAVRSVANGEWPYVLAFDKSIHLTRDETQCIYRAGIQVADNGDVPRRLVPGRRVNVSDRLHYEGIGAISRELWEKIGGADERYVGYGAEDYAITRGVEIYTRRHKSTSVSSDRSGRGRVAGTQLGLWHPAERGLRASASRDPYWEARERNVALYERTAARCRTPGDWERYLTQRDDELRATREEVTT